MVIRLRRGTFTVALVVVCATGGSSVPARAFVSPAVGMDESAEIVGNYRNEGIGVSGEPYLGTARIEALGGSRYRFAYTNGKGDAYEGVGLRRSTEVLVAWSKPACRVASYQINATTTELTLEGAWTELAANGVGKETMRLYVKSSIPSEPVGYFSVSGERPDGKTYSGSLDIYGVTGPSGIYRFYLNVPGPEGKYYRGVAFRDGDRLFAAMGTYATGYACGPVHYRITQRGRVLPFRYVDPFVPHLGFGIGTLTRV